MSEYVCVELPFLEKLAELGWEVGVVARSPTNFRTRRNSSDLLETLL
jgi:hypothetical protein